MQKATLGGIQGAADLHCRRQADEEAQWRGFFFFPKEEESAVAKLVNERRPVTYEAIFEGEPKRLDVKLTSLSPDGTVYFEAVGDPY